MDRKHYLRTHKITPIEPKWAVEVMYKNLCANHDEVVVFNRVNAHELITRIHIHSCSLSNIPVRTFNIYPNAKNFEMVSSHLRYIDEKSFSFANHLQELDLSFNNIKILKTNLFQNAKNLRKIRMKYNQIGNIHPGAFNGLEHLTELDLSNNAISATRNGIFDSLAMLEKIDLSSNALTMIEENTFINNKKLKTIKLNANQIFHIEERNLLSDILYDEIDVSDNCLRKFECSSTNLLNLSNASTNLSEVRIHGYVTKLIVTSNNLKLLKITQCPMLIYLNIQGNPDLRLDFLSECINMRELIMSGMNLTYLDPYTFENVPNLKVLDLSINLFEQLNVEMFRNLRKLEKLKLNDNILRELRHNDIISMCPNIMEISIQRNNFCKEFYQIVQDDLNFGLRFKFDHFA